MGEQNRLKQGNIKSMKIDKANWIKPDWPAPAAIQAVSTTRQGGVSHPPYDSLNLGLHVEDQPEHVLANRQILTEQLDLPGKPYWLEQVHSAHVVHVNSDIDTVHDNTTPHFTADAMVSHQPGKVCVVMTADCLPVLMTNRQGNAVAAAHAGWRGLRAGILEQTLQAMQTPADEILIWLGPAISQQHFEVGDEVRTAFLGQHEEAKLAFREGGQSGKWYADIYQLARIRLQALGVSRQQIFGGEYCTYAQSERFFSYRRSPKTGRMASLIWISP